MFKEGDKVAYYRDGKVEAKGTITDMGSRIYKWGFIKQRCKGISRTFTETGWEHLDGEGDLARPHIKLGWSVLKLDKFFKL